MPFRPIERKAAFIAACVMKGELKSKAAEEHIGISWTHLDAVLLGIREGSLEVREKVASYVGVPAEEFWLEPPAAVAV